MISDILFEAKEDIREYLQTNSYDDHSHDKINALLEHMNSVRAYLDRPPEKHKVEGIWIVPDNTDLPVKNLPKFTLGQVKDLLDQTEKLE